MPLDRSSRDDVDPVAWILEGRVKEMESVGALYKGDGIT